MYDKKIDFEPSYFYEADLMRCWKKYSSCILISKNWFKFLWASSVVLFWQPFFPFEVGQNMMMVANFYQLDYGRKWCSRVVQKCNELSCQCKQFIDFSLNPKSIVQRLPHWANIISWHTSVHPSTSCSSVNLCWWNCHTSQQEGIWWCSLFSIQAN